MSFNVHVSEKMKRSVDFALLFMILELFKYLPCKLVGCKTIDGFAKCNYLIIYYGTNCSYIKEV